MTPSGLRSCSFDGTVDPEGSALRPDRSRPALGLELKRADATEYQLYGGRYAAGTYGWRRTSDQGT